jgi:hypothetical protein
MPQAQTMTDEEKVDKAYQSALLSQAGDEEGSIRLLRSIPLPPYLAKVMKEKVGADFLINSGYNLSEAEAEFGQGWLTN